MTFQITREECNKLIHAYQTEAFSLHREFRGSRLDSEIEKRRARIAQLAQHAAFLGGRRVKDDAAGVALCAKCMQQKANCTCVEFMGG